MAVVKIPAGLGIPVNTAEEGTTPLGVRLALSALIRQSPAGTPVPGRLGADQFAVAGKSDWSYDVSGGGIVIPRPSQGVYILGLPQTVNVGTSPASGTNPRIDRIYIHQPDPQFDGAAVDVQAEIGVVVGIAGASPAVPDIPVGAFELARKLIAPDALNTLAGSFTNVADVSGLNLGGVLPVALGGTGANAALQALNNLGIYPQATQPPVAPAGQVRIWIKTS